MMLLVVGAMLALGALVWVLLPLITRASVPLAHGVEAEESPAEEDLRELALDVAAGRLSRAEFERLTRDSH